MMLPFKHHGHLNAMASMNDAPSHGADLCRQLQLVDEYLASYVNSIRFANQQLVSCMTSLSDTNNYIACSFCTKTGRKKKGKDVNEHQLVERNVLHTWKAQQWE